MKFQDFPFCLRFRSVTDKCLVFRTFQHFSLNISPRFHSIEKLSSSYLVGVLGPVIKKFENLLLIYGLFGRMLKIMENWKILDLKVVEN